jgi:hypothetical protein
MVVYPRLPVVVPDGGGRNELGGFAEPGGV